MSYPSALVAEAEGTDAAGLPALGCSFALGAETGLRVLPSFSDHEHVGQVRDVAGGQPQCLYLGELPVHRVCGDEGPQGREGRVHVLGPVPLAGVGHVPLPHYAAGPAAEPGPRSPATRPVPLVGAAVAAAAVCLLLVVRQRRDVSRVGEGVPGYQHGRGHQQRARGGLTVTDTVHT